MDDDSEDLIHYERLEEKLIVELSCYHLLANCAIYQSAITKTLCVWQSEFQSKFESDRRIASGVDSIFVSKTH